MRRTGTATVVATSLTLLASGLAVGSAYAGELTLKSLQVNNPLTAGVPYEVKLPYIKSGDIKVDRGCFTWSGEGPYCSDVSVRTQTIRAKLRTGNPNKYRLGAFVEYRSGGKKLTSNTVFAPIDVRPKNASSNNTGSKSGPKIESADADIKCAQQGLLDAGHDPNGVDGAIGKGTRRAAANYQASPDINLPDIKLATVANWCRHFQAKKSVPESKVEAGTYRAVFSGNFCGVLNVDYGKGHFYRSGTCNAERTDIKDGSDIWQTGLVDVSDQEIKVLEARHELLEIKPDKLTGKWTLGGNTIPVLVFMKVK